MALRRSDQIAGSLQDVAILSSLPDDDTNVLFVSSRTLYLLANLSEKEVWNYRSYFTEALDGGLVRTVEPDDTEAEFVDEVANRFALEVVPVDDIRPIISATMYKTAAGQGISNATQTKVVWGAVDDDPEGMANLSTEQFTVPRDGRYTIIGKCVFAGNATGQRILYIVRNSEIIAVTRLNAQGAVNHYQEVVASAILEAGDTVQLDCHQDSGGILALQYISTQLYVSSLTIIGF